ncbi:MAG: hypothetical protein ACLTCI_06060 [[Clostridium] nexile]
MMDSIYQYHLDTNENELYHESELKSLLKNWLLVIDGILDKGIVFSVFIIHRHVLKEREWRNPRVIFGTRSSS